MKHADKVPQPWESWKDKTPLEERAIASLEAAKRIILENVPHGEIVAIYAKGSFVRREMNEKSDLDTLTIVRHSRTLGKLKRLEDEYRHRFSPQLQIGGYSLWELKHNKNVKSGKKMRASPSRTAMHLKHFFLLYGTAIEERYIASRTPERQLKGLIGAFNDLFLPGYAEGTFKFQEIVKQVFWLAENEQRYLGNDPPYSWKGLDTSIKNKDHIVHDAYHYRLNPTKDKRKRAAFINKLTDYLKKLEECIR